MNTSSNCLLCRRFPLLHWLTSPSFTKADINHRFFGVNYGLIYLFFGMDGKNGLMPWIYTALTLNIIATTILTIHTFRKNIKWLSFACIILFVAIWIDKGMGLVIPGFIPGAWGDVAEYTLLL